MLKAEKIYFYWSYASRGVLYLYFSKVFVTWSYLEPGILRFAT